MIYTQKLKSNPLLNRLFARCNTSIMVDFIYTVLVKLRRTQRRKAFLKEKNLTNGGIRTHNLQNPKCDAQPALPISYRLRGTGSFTLLLTTNVRISTFITQTFRSGVAISHLHSPMTFFLNLTTHTIIQCLLLFMSFF